MRDHSIKPANDRARDAEYLAEFQDEVQAVPQATPMQMLQVAVEGGADLAMVERLMDLQERWEATEARKEFVAALSAFKADPPTLVRDKHVHFSTQKGQTDYRHASLDQVSEVIGKALSKHGLSHRWDVDQNGNEIRVTCVLTHVRGHRESVPMVATADTSGSKNPIQAIGSTITYLQRYTLLAATGMAVKDQDDDGRKGGAETITEEQIANLEALMTEVGADRGRFLKWAKANKLADIQASFYPVAIKMLEAKRK